MLDVPGEARLLGHGVSTCATCDGFFFRDQEIAVVGGGDSALEEASFLTRFGESVTLIHRRKELRASKIMQDRAFANDKIDFVWDTVVDEVLGDTKVSGIAVAQHRHRRGVRPSPPAACSSPSATCPTPPCSPVQLDMDENGYIRTHDGTRTSVDGVFACGDVQDHIYRQAITVGRVGLHGRHRRRAVARGPGRSLTPSPSGMRGRSGQRCFLYVR